MQRPPHSQRHLDQRDSGGATVSARADARRACPARASIVLALAVFLNGCTVCLGPHVHYHAASSDSALIADDGRSPEWLDQVVRDFLKSRGLEFPDEPDE